MAELEDALIGIMEQVPPGGVGHLLNLPASNLAECPDAAEVERRMQNIHPSHGRIYRIKADVDGVMKEAAFVVGRMIVPTFATFDRRPTLHPLLCLTLSPSYPSFLKYAQIHFERLGSPNQNRTVHLMDIEVVN